MRLQIKGVATQAINTFVKRMFQKHPWLTWSGLFLSDPLKVLGAAYTCACKSEAEATLKWQQFELSKCTAAGSVQEVPADVIHPWTPVGPVPTTPPKLVQQFRGVDEQALSPMKVPSPAQGVSISSSSKDPPGPLTAWPAWHKPNPTLPGVNSWPDRLPVNGIPLKKETVVDEEAENLAELEETLAEEVKERVDINEKNHSAAPTQIDMEAGQEDMDPDTKRAKLSCEPHGSEHDKAELSMDENGTFVQMLQGFLNVVKENFQTLCSTFIKNESLENLKTLAAHIEVMETCFQDRRTLRSDAEKTVSSLVEFFAEYPELEDAVHHLKKWQIASSRNGKNSTEAGASLGQILQRLVQAWDNGWEEQKAKLLKKEDWQALSNLKATRDKLQTWISQEEAPTEEDVLRELKGLASFQSCQDWSELEDVLLTAEELMKAGTQQHNLHLLYDLPLAITNGSAKTA